MVLINDNSTVLNIGDPLPHFALPAVDQPDPSVPARADSGLAGNSTVDTMVIDAPVLVVIFSCNHCPYAQAYEDRLIKIAREFEFKGVQFVMVNSNDAAQYPEDSFEEMQKRQEEKHFPFPYCFDESQETAKSYGALCTPHCFVFDAHHTLQYKGRVDDNWKDPKGVTQENLRDAIAALVDGREPTIHEANAIGCSIKWRESN